MATATQKFRSRTSPSREASRVGSNAPRTNASISQRVDVPLIGQVDNTVAALVAVLVIGAGAVLLLGGGGGGGEQVVFR